MIFDIIQGRQVKYNKKNRQNILIITLLCNRFHMY